ncbi:MAG: subclass B1 metallo-beta-lactamase [Bacteroidota bacterium]|nr:subclass B1 metallo-beta-lactamase [Bacteroidota bacterium]
MKKSLLFVIIVLACQVVRSQDTIKISEDLELIRISENALIHVSSAVLPGYGRVFANGLIYTDRHKAYLFDTPWNNAQTELLVTFLEKEMRLKIKVFVPNHWHEDCMGGMRYLKSRKIRSYASSRTCDIAREKGLPVPDNGFIDSLILNPGKKEILCYFPGAAHSLDNIVVWIASEKILFPGCICKSIDTRNLGNTADGDTASYPTTVEWIIRKFPEAMTVIPGHGSYGGPELLIHTRHLAAGNLHPEMKQ